MFASQTVADYGKEGEEVHVGRDGAEVEDQPNKMVGSLFSLSSFCLLFFSRLVKGLFS